MCACAFAYVCGNLRPHARPHACVHACACMRVCVCACAPVRVWLCTRACLRVPARACVDDCVRTCHAHVQHARTRASVCRWVGASVRPCDMHVVEYAVAALGDNGCAFLQEALTTNTTLETLYLNGVNTQCHEFPCSRHYTSMVSILNVMCSHARDIIPQWCQYSMS